MRTLLKSEIDRIHGGLARGAQIVARSRGVTAFDGPPLSPVESIGEDDTWQTGPNGWSIAADPTAGTVSLTTPNVPIGAYGYTGTYTHNFGNGTDSFTINATDGPTTYTLSDTGGSGGEIDFGGTYTDTTNNNTFSAQVVVFDSGIDMFRFDFTHDFSSDAEPVGHNNQPDVSASHVLHGNHATSAAQIHVQ